MLPSNIDLTEHRDFADHRTDIDISIPEGLTLLSTVTSDDDVITADQYELLVYIEGIFGKRGHINRKTQIFKNPNSPFLYNGIYDPDSNRCYCCGKYIRLPWNNHGGICVECIHKKPVEEFPWKTYAIPSSRNIMDLFNMR